MDTILGIIFGLAGLVLAALLVIGILSIPVLGIARLYSWVLARMLTPPGQLRFRDLKRSEAWISLAGEGYGITPNWDDNAVAALMKEKGK